MPHRPRHRPAAPAGAHPPAGPGTGPALPRGPGLPVRVPRCSCSSTSDAAPVPAGSSSWRSSTGRRRTGTWWWPRSARARSGGRTPWRTPQVHVSTGFAAASARRRAAAPTGRRGRQLERYAREHPRAWRRFEPMLRRTSGDLPPGRAAGAARPPAGAATAPPDAARSGPKVPAGGALAPGRASRSCRRCSRRRRRGEVPCPGHGTCSRASGPSARPAPPGPPACPPTAAAELARELQPVFDDLADAQEEAARIRADARRRRGPRGGARRPSRRGPLVAAARRDAEAQRAEAAARVLRDVEQETAATLAAADREAADIARRRGRPRTPSGSPTRSRWPARPRSRPAGAAVPGAAR